MADHPNVALVRKGYDAFKSGDMDTLRELFADDIVWHSGGDNPLSGEYKGQDEVFELFGRFLELTGGTVDMQIHDVVANDEHAVALLHVTAEREGKRLDQNEVHVLHVRDGKVTEFWGFEEDQAAANAFLS